MNIDSILVRAASMRKGFITQSRERQIDGVLGLKSSFDAVLKQERLRGTDHALQLRAWKQFLSALAPLVACIKSTPEPIPPLRLSLMPIRRHRRQLRNRCVKASGDRP